MHNKKILIIYLCILFSTLTLADSISDITIFLKKGEDHKAFQLIESLSSSKDALRFYSSIARTIYYEKLNIEWTSKICYGAISFAFRKYYESNSSDRDEYLFKVSNLNNFILNSIWEYYIDKKNISPITIDTCLKISEENIKICGLLKKPDYEAASAYFLSSRIYLINQNLKKAMQKINTAMSIAKRSDTEDYNYYNAYSGLYLIKSGNRKSGNSIIELSISNLKNSKKDKSGKYLEEIRSLKTR